MNGLMAGSATTLATPPIILSGMLLMTHMASGDPLKDTSSSPTASTQEAEENNGYQLHELTDQWNGVTHGGWMSLRK